METLDGVDSVVRSVVESFLERARKGKEKYGTDLDRQDLSVVDWIQHAQEEHMDAILYLEKLKRVASCSTCPSCSPCPACPPPPPPASCLASCPACRLYPNQTSKDIEQ